MYSMLIYAVDRISFQLLGYVVYSYVTALFLRINIYNNNNNRNITLNLIDFCHEFLFLSCKRFIGDESSLMTNHCKQIMTSPSTILKKKILRCLPSCVEFPMHSCISFLYFSIHCPCNHGVHNNNMK